MHNRFINKVINVISRVIYCLIFPINFQKTLKTVKINEQINLFVVIIKLYLVI